MVFFGDTLANYYALDAKNGTKVWHYSASDSNLSNGMALNDHILYFVSAGSVHALDAKTGQEKWKVIMNILSGFIPAYDNGVLYADGNGFPMAAYDAATGKVLWKSPIIFGYFILTSPAVGQNSVYFGNDRDALYALDKKTGAIKWKLGVGGANGEGGVDAAVAMADGMVYFGGMDGKLYAIKDQ